MKALAMIFLTIFLGKSCSDSDKNDIYNATIEYTALSRGFYQEIVIANKTVTVSNDRKRIEEPRKIAITEEDWNELVGYFEKINLEKLQDYKDPTQYRFYDGAPSAQLTIRYHEKNYEAKVFDHGYPPKEIKELVNKIVSFGKIEKK